MLSLLLDSVRSAYDYPNKKSEEAIMTRHDTQEEIRKFAEKILKTTISPAVPAANEVLKAAKPGVCLANFYGLKAIQNVFNRSPSIASSAFSMPEAKLSAINSLSGNFWEAADKPFHFFQPALNEHALAKVLRRPDEPLTPVAVEAYDYLNDEQTINELVDFASAWFKASQNLCSIDHVSASFFVGGPRWLSAVLSDQTNSAIKSIVRSRHLTWRSRFDFDVLIDLLKNPSKPLPASNSASIFWVKEMFIQR